jgi:hypothetical protein
MGHLWLNSAWSKIGMVLGEQKGAKRTPISHLRILPHGPVPEHDPYLGCFCNGHRAYDKSKLIVENGSAHLLLCIFE